MRSRSRLLLAGVLAATWLAAATSVGCANPKYVAASTGGPDDIKFLYVDQGGGQGVIKCARAQDGSLSQCRRMRVVLVGE